MLFVRFNVSVPVSKLILKPAKRLVFNLGILQAGFCRLTSRWMQTEDRKAVRKTDLHSLWYIGFVCAKPV